MHEENVRWQQRFNNFLKAFSLLEQAVAKYNEEGLSELEEQGLIQRFEFTHELAWNVLKDYFEYQGNNEIMGSRDATREAFSKGLLQDGEGWMEMIKSRSKSSHTYNEETAKELVGQITKSYCHLFFDFKTRMTQLTNK